MVRPLQPGNSVAQMFQNGRFVSYKHGTRKVLWKNTYLKILGMFLSMNYL